MSTDPNDILLEYEKADYRVYDSDFSQYLDGVCAGEPVTAAYEDITGLSLRVAEIPYEDPRFSSTWSFDQNAPYCSVDSALHLLTRDVPPLPGP